MASRTEVAAQIIKELEAVKELLLAKNREYGNSALEPIGVFSGLPARQQIAVRIDDKLKRIQTTRQMGDGVTIHEDTRLDLIGYLILDRVAEHFEKRLDAVRAVHEKEASRDADGYLPEQRADIVKFCL